MRAARVLCQAPSETVRGGGNPGAVRAFLGAVDDGYGSKALRWLHGWSERRGVDQAQVATLRLWDDLLGREAWGRSDWMSRRCFVPSVIRDAVDREFGPNAVTEEEQLVALANHIPLDSIERDLLKLAVVAPDDFEQIDIVMDMTVGALWERAFRVLAIIAAQPVEQVACIVAAALREARTSGDLTDVVPRGRTLDDWVLHDE